MKILHVAPKGCLFEDSIRKSANDFGHDVMTYTTVTRFRIIRPKSMISLLCEIKRRPNDLVIFHFIPHYTILLISLMLSKFKYGLQYWGEDYYSTFLPIDDFERHCLKKNTVLEHSYYNVSLKNHRSKVFKCITQYIGLLVVRRATVILSLSPKQFRVLRMLHMKYFSKPISVPQVTVRNYSNSEYASSHCYCKHDRPGLLNVLICHSAAETVHHKQTVELLKRYSEDWGVDIGVFGFLSYSGGGEDSRRRLELELKNDLDYAETVHFEQSFLTTSELSMRLRHVDVAVFSSLRDEGVGLLTQFVKMGGVVCFNRYSMNFDFFRYASKEKLLSHEDFFKTSPHDIIKIRKQATMPFPAAVEYGEVISVIEQIKN